MTIIFLGECLVCYKIHVALFKWALSMSGSSEEEKISKEELTSTTSLVTQPSVSLLSLLVCKEFSWERRFLVQQVKNFPTATGGL